MHGHPPPREIATGPAEHRTVALADGTTIALNGDSRLRLDPATPRLASLERGEAYFTVAHDAAHPFEVRSGGATFRDVGTQFDLVRQPGATEIAVREGAVLYDPGGAGVRIDGGHAMRIAAGSATLRAVAADSVGAWRSGRLTYRDAALIDVAADVSCAIGEPVAVAPELAQRRFSGVVMIDPDHALTVRRMGAVMGIELRREGPGWRMVSPTR
jgi:transmembrane sensor